MSETIAVDEIVLRVPASAIYARIVRVAAAAVALRQGMSFTEIDELRAAMDQATELLLEQPAPDAAAIECVLSAHRGCLEVTARRTDGAGVAATSAARFSRAMSNRDMAVTVDPGGGRLQMRKEIGRPGSRPAA